MKIAAQSLRLPFNATLQFPKGMFAFDFGIHSKSLHFCLALVSILVTLATATPDNNVVAVYNPITGHAMIYVGGLPYFESVDVSTMSGGKKYTTADGSLVYDSHTAVAGHDGIGDWNGTSTTWKAGSTPFITTVRYYNTGGGERRDQAFVVFEQTWPEGAANVSTNATDPKTSREDVLSSFPSIIVGEYPSYMGIYAGNRGYLALQGDMCGMASQAGPWSTGATLPSGLKGTGPTVVFDQDQVRSAVISPFSQFFTASYKFDNSSSSHILRAGTMGSVLDLPPGYSTSTIVHGGSNHAPGVNAAVRSWGHTMRRAYGKADDVPDKDFTLRTLQYSTDNGAVYYYNTEPNKTYQETIVEVADYAKKEGIPYRTWLVDSWWYPKDSRGAVTEWVPMPSVFPDGFYYIYNQTTWKSIAHNRYWSQNTTYAKQNGGGYDFIFSGNYALPVEVDLWVHIMTDPEGPGSTMDVYEQDWLDVQTDAIPALTQNATLGRQWLLQMNEGAEISGKYIQMCMSHTRHILQSLEMSQVSQARASGDYASSDNTQWIVGLSSMLANAVGIAPSKDNAWSETDQPLAQNKYHDNRTEPRNRLESAVLSLSRGPVAFSDQIGLSNKAIIMSTCRADGVLLRPDRSATLVDKVIGNRAFQGEGGSSQLPDGEVWSTESSVQDQRFVHVLSANLSGSLTLSPADLGLNQTDGPLPPPVKGFVAFEHNDSRSLVDFSEESPLRLSPSDEYNFQLWHVSPVAENGWALLGEVSKWVPTSADRFLAWSVAGDGASVTLQGQAGEKVQVSFARDRQRVDVACMFGESGRLVASVPSATCEDPGRR